MHPRRILEQLDKRPYKPLSQNFLSSTHWAEKLATPILDTDATALWEVGPGLGAITEHLVKDGRPVTVFEADKSLEPHLKDTFPQTTIVLGDFLKQDLTPYMLGNSSIGLVSNLPYHISTPVLFRILENKVHFCALVLGFQKEVAGRLIAKPRTPSYGALSVLIQSCFSIQSLGVIPPGAFYPSPSVDSQALLLTPISTPIEYGLLNRVVKTAFRHRRKMMIGNLKSGFESKNLVSAFEKLNLNSQCRAEELSVSEFHRLAEELG